VVAGLSILLSHFAKDEAGTPEVSSLICPFFSVVSVCSYVNDGGDVSEDPSIIVTIRAYVRTLCILHASGIATICYMFDRESP